MNADKDRSRMVEAGASLWMEWDGIGYETTPQNVVIYTIGDVDPTNEFVNDTVARALQRFGIVEGLGEAYRVLTVASVVHGYLGYLEDGDTILHMCLPNGDTTLGESVNQPEAATWIEVTPDA